MKDYLSQNEQDIWLVLVLAIAELEDSLPKMASNLTKDETKWLKTIVTLSRKSYNSMMDRLGPKAIKKLHKYGTSCNIQVMSKEQSKIVSEREVKEQNQITIDIDILFNLATSLTKLSCRDCKKKCGECYLHGILQDITFIGYEVNSNCPYSYNSQEGTEKALEEVVESRAKSKKNRHNKKFKNRYDDDGETYVYKAEKKSV